MIKIKHYRAEISDGTGTLRRVDNTFKMTEYNVIGENDQRMVIDDTFFTTLERVHRKYACNPSIDKASIHISTADSFWGNRITYNLYTPKTKKASTIRKEIEKEVSKRFGFFTGKLDLSIIED